MRQRSVRGMKDLALVKLTKKFVTKVKDKVAAKKRVWAEEAALSVEENKRREAEFKEDFKHVKETISAGTQKAKKSIEATIESGEKVQAQVSTSTKNEIDTKIVEKEKTNTATSQKTTTTSKSQSTVTTAKKTTKKVKTEKKNEKVTKSVNPDKTSVKELKSKETVVKKQPKKESSDKAEKKTTKVTEKKSVATPKKTATKSDVKPKKESKSSVEASTQKASKQVDSKSETVSKTAKTKVASGSKKEAKIALYTKDVAKHYGKVDEAFLAIIVNNLGPSIYKKDAESVACSDPKELETVRKNFLVKKLGMRESQEVLDSAIKEVCEEMKASRNKYRATFYYALAKKLKQESKLS